MKWSVSDIPLQFGKVAIVTGANAGIGRETVRVLAQKGTEVVLAVRNVSKGENAAEAIRSEQSGARLHVMELDLGDLASVRAFADQFSASFEWLDILINNAGFYAAKGSEKSQDGFALMMAVNHLGHFALTVHLLDRLLAAPRSRVVTVSSGAHSSGKIDPETFHTVGAARKGAYANSKLANMLFMLELQREFERRGADAVSVAAGPGPTKSDGVQQAIQSISNGFLHRVVDVMTGVLMNPAAEGAWPVLRAATDPEAGGGAYFTPGGFMSMRGAPVAKAPAKSTEDKELSAAFWERSASLTGVQQYNLQGE